MRKHTRVFSRLLYSGLAVILLNSCGVMGKMFTEHEGKSDISVEELSNLHQPAGTLVDVYCKSSVNGPSERRVIVYLPEEYDRNPDKHYPTLYIFHGARGNETSWIQDGKLIETTEKLVADGKVRPFVIVMPNMNQYNDDSDYRKSRFKRPVESFLETNGAVESGFMKDVMEKIEKEFRVVPDKEHRAVAGLSIGGLQAIYLSANHPFSFDAVALFSPMHKAFIAPSEYNEFYSNLNAKQKLQFSTPPRLYSIYIGSRDIFYFNIEYYRKYLTWNGFPFTYTESSGGHEWECWREFYGQFISECFK